MNTMLMQQALNCYKSGDKQKAADLLKELVSQEPNNADAWYGLALCADTSSSKIDFFRKVLVINPNHEKAKQALDKLISPSNPVQSPGLVQMAPQYPASGVNVLAFCPTCGAPVLTDSKFCGNCGNDFSNIQTSSYQRQNYLKTPRVGKSVVPSGAKTLGTISLICGLIGLCFGGIPLGVIAIACGIPASSKGDSNGTAGIIMGIIDIVAAVCILSFASTQFSL